MQHPSRFAQRVFLGCGIYGLVVLMPQYFLEAQLNQDFPPPITHPEYFYGFVGVALAWQIAFLVIASDVRRYRPLMLPCVLEKVSFGAAAVVLFWQTRIPATMLVAGLLDLVMGGLFIAAYRVTGGASAERGSES